MASIGLIRASNGVGEAVRGSVTNARSPGATTLTVDSIINWPQTFIATTGEKLPDDTLDPSSVLVFEGHLSGSSIEIVNIAPGYIDQGSSVGDVVLIKPTTPWADEIADVLAVSHKDDGSIAQIDPNEPGIAFSASAIEPGPDPGGRVIVWLEPL